MQIEAGGDASTVNDYLVKALHALSLRRWVKPAEKNAIEALDRFVQAERDRSQKLTK